MDKQITIHRIMRRLRVLYERKPKPSSVTGKVDISRWIADQEEIYGEREKDTEKYEQLHKELLQVAMCIMLPHLKQVSSEQYSPWLRAYLASGGKPTHYYKYLSSTWTWYSATSDFTVVPLFGTPAIAILVPKGIQVTVTAEGIGHNGLYYFDLREHTYVPVFSDFKEKK